MLRPKLQNFQPSEFSNSPQKFAQSCGNPEIITNYRSEFLRPCHPGCHLAACCDDEDVRLARWDTCVRLHVMLGTLIYER